MTNLRFIKNFIAVQILVLSPFFSSVYADDTEIFFNIEQEVSAPNILFILDNSGSMRTEVRVKAADYDPTINYSGSYTTNDVYYLDGRNYYRISRSALQCDDIESKLNTLGKTGTYRMAHWEEASLPRYCELLPWLPGCSGDAEGGSWQSLNREDVTEGPVVCEADESASDDINWSKIEAHEYSTGNYRNWHANHRTDTWVSRLEIVKQVANNLADGIEGMNIGLMSFDEDGRNAGEGGKILQPIGPVSEVRSAFKQAVNGLLPETNTPLAETLFGAKRYFEGNEPFLSPARRQHDDSVSDGKYNSPIDLECQANHIVLLTDGVPTYDDNHNSTIRSEIDVTGCAVITDDNNRRVQNCLAEIAEYMFEQDISDDYIGHQRVITHTVGFQTNQELLNRAATAGGGKYYVADNADELENAFYSIFREVLSTNTTFASPGVSVSNFNQLNHLDSLYFSVFEPVVQPLWPGNLKRYRLQSDGTIVDRNGNPAIDQATGFFRDSAQSYWSPSVDGAAAGQGGAASVIDADNSKRKVYTYLGGSQSLSNASNAVSLSNIDNLGKELFGNPDMLDEQHKLLVRWTRGQDVLDEDRDGNTTESRKFLADPLHSRPYLQVFGGDQNNPDTTIFYGDNQGFLHAIDGETGEAEFSFIPAELLINQNAYMNQRVLDGPRPYGMDGSVVAWFDDRNGDRIVNGSDSVYIYSGMRRGGRSYYALDVTDRASPSMLWTISGGSGDFAELGQTWADPVKHRVRIGDSVKDVLFLSGGYDPRQDGVNVRTEDAMGRAIYMVDAVTGDRLWWAGNSASDANLKVASMNYSIPAAPAVIDVNGDGLADQLYVGDMGGQILRFDFNNGQGAAGFATGGVIASLAGSGSASNRRFYYSPDISGTLRNGRRYLNLAIGSGYQAHPLDKVIDDRFYKLTIDSVDAPRNDDGDIEYSILTESDLMDTTDNVIQQGDADEKEAAANSLAEAKGWYIRLTRNGEKVLSSSTTLRGDLYFTTFEPSANLDPCIPAAGQSRLYHVKLWDGRAVVNYDKIGGDADENLTASDRYVTLKTLGLPPSPQTITIDGVEIIVSGAETLMPPDPGGLVRKIYWYEE